MIYRTMIDIMCASYTSWIKAVFTIKEYLPHSIAGFRFSMFLTNTEGASKFYLKSCPVKLLIKSNSLKQKDYFKPIFHYNVEL